MVTKPPVGSPVPRKVGGPACAAHGQVMLAAGGREVRPGVRPWLRVAGGVLLMTFALLAWWLAISTGWRVDAAGGSCGSQVRACRSVSELQCSDVAAERAALERAIAAIEPAAEAGRLAHRCLHTAPARGAGHDRISR